MRYANDPGTLFLGMRVCSDSLLRFLVPELVPRVRDYVSWKLLASTGIDASAYKQVVLSHGGDDVLWSQLSKSAQTVLFDAGFDDFKRRTRRRGRSPRRVTEAVDQV
jgi:hypothetical protein